MARTIDFPPEKRHISQSGLFLLGEMNSALKTELLESTLRGIYMQSTWYQHFLDKHRFCICLMQGILTISEGRPSSCGWSISWTLVCGGLVFLLQCLYAACSIFCGALSTALPLSVPVTQAPTPGQGGLGIAVALKFVLPRPYTAEAKLAADQKVSPPSQTALWPVTVPLSARPR